MSKAKDLTATTILAVSRLSLFKVPKEFLQEKNKKENSLSGSQVK